jgi:hypothetical protein
MDNEFSGWHISRIRGLRNDDANVADKAGTDVKERFQYDPYGMQDQPACQEGEGKTTCGSHIVFQGGMTDLLAKTVRFVARDFNPAVGRWMD